MDTDTKTFDSWTLLTVYTGIGMPNADFGNVHAAIEHLLGESVLTSQYAVDDTRTRASRALAIQYPVFDTLNVALLHSTLADAGDDSSARKTAAATWAMQACAGLGADTFVLTKGNGRSYDEATADALANIAARDMPLIVLGSERG